MGALGKNKIKKSYSKNEVSKLLKFKEKELKNFEELGIFRFSNKSKNKVDGKNFERLKVASSLMNELGVNPEGIDVILGMREKMAQMQNQFNDFLDSVRMRMDSQLDEDIEKIRRLKKKGKI